VTLFIATDTAASGAGNVFPQNATVDLFSISHADLGDATHAGYGEAAPANNLVQVTYSRTDPGIPAVRLDSLVNTNFGVNANNIDIIIVAAGGNFTLLDGSVTAGNGFTFPVGNADNPTGSVLVIYDTSDNNGSGLCVRKQGDGSGTYSIEEPETVILYHELSHAFHLANGDPLSLSASGCTASPEENRAETDENDVRDQLGLPHRDPTDHCGNPGCQSSCCIVASVATGSIYSEAVNSLRDVRDGVLRCSEVGYEFFNYLLEDYYGFSPEVCKLMARSPDLQELVRVRYVGTLTFALKLLRARGIEGLDGFELGAYFEASANAAELSNLSMTQLELGRAILTGAAFPELTLALAPELASLLRERAAPSPYVRWALMDPITILIDALCWRIEGLAAPEIGRRIAERFDEWSVQMPVTPVWRKISKYALNEELEFLENTLLRTSSTRQRFAQRLIGILPPDKLNLVEERWGSLAP
jgi:hypothetical protein